jgi:hypothetical protein
MDIILFAKAILILLEMIVTPCTGGGYKVHLYKGLFNGYVLFIVHFELSLYLILFLRNVFEVKISNIQFVVR